METPDDAVAEVEKLFLDLLAATLAVNRFSLAQAYDVARRLGAQGITRPGVVTQMDESAIASQLALAGYSRGEYMAGLMGVRIARLAHSMSDAKIQQILDMERAGDVRSVERQLLTHPGVGPVVIENFRMLRSDG